MESHSSLAIGIDLGTTNSAIAIWRNGVAELIPNALGEYLTPSVVSIDEEGHVLVGEAARARLVTKPTETVAAFKRFMGSEKQFKLGAQSYTPTELSALVLKSLKADAEAHLGTEIQDVVISVPAYFSDQQRKQVYQAALLADLNAVRLINEPTAACLAYSLKQEQERRFLVFDLGGGTFDVTVVEYQDSFVEVRSSTGDNRLGGEDFTEALVNYVVNELGLKLETIDINHLAKLVSICERGKKQSGETMVLELPDPFNQTLELNGKQLEQVWHDVLTRLALPLKRALNDAKMTPAEIDELIFVGGATRLRQVQQLANRLLGRFGSHQLDPDLVVAMGAATQAACRLRDEAVEELILTDVCPFSLGIIVNSGEQSGVFSPIIERNTVIPTSRVERYYTSYDDQDKVNVGIYQGERYWARENIYVDNLEIDVPEGPRGQEAIDVRFSYDINGLLEIDVTVVSTQKTSQKVIDRSPIGMTPEQQTQSRERLEKLKVHPRDQLPNITLAEKLNRLYEELLGDGRETVGEMIAYFTKALDSQDDKVIRDARKEIEAHLNRFVLV
ncbi:MULTISPECIES: Hsp70 family protein [Vibrio]|uniref:Hsp70 family protein n=2 Tax=Vibrio TaxID=662 RepID=A0A7X4LPE0_9VIBR|nr:MULTISPECIES: Hsp70 family protein [Vibrio]MBF9003596.1 Hsp70 family protein [Vibrio nitrifigilis]MZI95728.1 Hsp70 family protein [Vibrio eleionomae]